jgi:hypothetical protein
VRNGAGFLVLRPTERHPMDQVTKDLEAKQLREKGLSASIPSSSLTTSASTTSIMSSLQSIMGDGSPPSSSTSHERILIPGFPMPADWTRDSHGISADETDPERIEYRHQFQLQFDKRLTNFYCGRRYGPPGSCTCGK